MDVPKASPAHRGNGEGGKEQSMNATALETPQNVAFACGMPADLFAHLDAYLSSYCDRAYADSLAVRMIRRWSDDPTYWTANGWKYLRESV
jgi:hypothetical protein